MMLKQRVRMVSRTRQSGKGRDPGMREDWSLTLQKEGWDTGSLFLVRIKS